MVVRGYRAERRGARHHHPLRPGDGRHDGPAGGADVERVRAVRRRASRWRAPPTRRAARSNTAPAFSSRPSGHVLTDRNLIDGCNVIALPGLGNAERVATDASGELALLRVYGARNLDADRHDRRRAAERRRASRWSASPIRRRRAAARRSPRSTRKLGAAASTRPLETVAGAGILRRRRARRAGPLRRHGGDEGAGGRRARRRAAGRRGAGRAHPEFPRGQLRRAGVRQAGRRGDEGFGDAGDLRAGSDRRTALTCS